MKTLIGPDVLRKLLLLLDKGGCVAVTARTYHECDYVFQMLMDALVDAGVPAKWVKPQGLIRIGDGRLFRVMDYNQTRGLEFAAALALGFPSGDVAEGIGRALHHPHGQWFYLRHAVYAPLPPTSPDPEVSRP